MKTELIGIGLGAASSIGGQMYGASQAAGAQQQQVEDQKGLMELGNNLAYKNWIRTNYSAQMEQMKKAGINPALMYGKGGAGGTLGGAPGGSASKADMPTMDIANAINNTRAIQSQIELQKAQADNLNADTKRKLGVETEEGYARINNLNANTGNTQADTAVKELQATSLEIDNYIKNNTANFQIEQAETLSEKLNEELTKLQISNYVDKKTAETAILQQKANLATTYLQQEATKAGIKLTQEQTRAISVELAQEWERLSLQSDRNKIDMNNSNIKLLETKIYKMLGIEANALTKRGQDMQAITNTIGIMKGKTTTRRGYSDTRGRFEETTTTN